MTPETLREIPLFATLDPGELQDLLKVLKKEKYPPNKVIFWMDESGDKLYVIEKGEVRISFSENGKEHTIATLGEKNFFGELSLLDAGPHTATARTNKETNLLTIDRAAFYSYLDTHPGFSRTMLAVLADRLRNSTVSLRHFVGGSKPASPPSANYRYFIDKAARFISSRRFLIFSFIFLTAWIGVQTWFYHQRHSNIPLNDDPPTFFFLGFILTLSSFLFTILVLTSQRGLAEQDRIQSEIEYQVNLKAQAEIMRLQLKMDEALKLLKEKEKE